MSIGIGVRLGSCANGGMNGGWLSLENTYQNIKLITIY